MSIDICKAMIYLHEKGFVHRDLKTDNLLVDENWTVKVTDFGLARFINERKQANNIAKTNNIGTVAWAAPEGNSFFICKIIFPDLELTSQFSVALGAAGLHVQS